MSRSRVFSRDYGLDAPTDGEVPNHGHAARLNRCDEVVEDLVGDVFVVDAPVAEFNHVELQRLELDAACVGHVGDADLAEIGQAGHRTHRGELWTPNRDLVFPLWPRVGEGLERRA